MIGDYNDQTNFPKNFFLTDRQILRPHKAFSNNLSANINLSKTQMSKVGGGSGEFLDRVFGQSLNTSFLLIKNILKLIAKSRLTPLRLTAAASATDAGIHKKLSDREKQH